MVGQLARAQLRRHVNRLTCIRHSARGDRRAVQPAAGLVLLPGNVGVFVDAVVDDTAGARRANDRWRRQAGIIALGVAPATRAAAGARAAAGRGDGARRLGLGWVGAARRKCRRKSPAQQDGLQMMVHGCLP